MTFQSKREIFHTAASVPVHVEPDITGLLTDDQLCELGRMKAGLFRIRAAIDNLNEAALETGLPLRQIPVFTLGLMSNDISSLAFYHDQAEKRIKAAAFQAVERVAA